MDSTTPYRLACDRCHAQKLRCRREWSGGGCVRCIKAKVQCVSSPSLRVRRGEDAHQRQQRAAQKPAPNSNSAVSVAQTGAPDDQSTSSSLTEDLSAYMDLDPSANSISDFEASLFDFSWATTAPTATFAPATEPFSSNSAAPADASASSHSPFNGCQPANIFSHENVMTSFPQPSPVRTSVSQPASIQSKPTAANQRDLWIRKLSHINIELYQHYVAASPSTNVSSSANDLSGRLEYFSSPSNTTTTAPGEHWCIDQTFIVTLQFLEALDDMVAASTSTSHGKRQHNRPDNCTVLLVFSCYLRLLEIYAALFRNLAASSSSSSSPSSSSPSCSSSPRSSSPGSPANSTTAPISPSASASSSPPNLALPRLCLGNLVIGPESPLHGGMVVHLAELLLARTHDAVGCVGGGGGGGGEGPPPSSSSSSASSPTQQRRVIGHHRADSAGEGVYEERGVEGEDGRQDNNEGDRTGRRRMSTQQLLQAKRSGVSVRKTAAAVPFAAAASSSSSSREHRGRRKPSLSEEGFWGQLRTTGDIPGVTVKAVREKEIEVRRFLEKVRRS